MGCCQSAPRNQYESSVYISGSGHAESSRAIAHEPSHLSPTSTTQATTLAPALTTESVPHRHGRHRRQNIAPSEHFNAPLKRHAWTSQRQWTRRELDREREEFFETRVTGRAEIWVTLRSVVELMGQGDLPTAQSILDAAAITVPTGSLKNGAYDEAGNLYQLPDHIISDPQNLVKETSAGPGEAAHRDLIIKEDEADKRREEKGKSVMKTGDIIKVKARLSDRGGPDIVISMGPQEVVRLVAKRVAEEADIHDKAKIKIAYMGKMLNESESLIAQGWHAGHVVNALVFPS